MGYGERANGKNGKILTIGDPAPAPTESKPDVLAANATIALVCKCGNVVFCPVISGLELYSHCNNPKCDRAYWVHRVEIKTDTMTKEQFIDYSARVRVATAIAQATPADIAAIARNRDV